VAYSAPVECKNWAGIIGNWKRFISSFLGIKNRIIGDVTSISTRAYIASKPAWALFHSLELTCIPEKLHLVVVDHPVLGVVQAISTVIPAQWDLFSWLSVRQLCATYKILQQKENVHHHYSTVHSPINGSFSLTLFSLH